MTTERESSRRRRSRRRAACGGLAGLRTARGGLLRGPGPLKAPMRRPVKLALAIGAGSEGAAHSHARRALAEGASREELEHVALLAIPTLGFPRAVAALTWIKDITKQG